MVSLLKKRGIVPEISLSRHEYPHPSWLQRLAATRRILGISRSLWLYKALPTVALLTPFHWLKVKPMD
jgi:hypothetical protein